MSNDIFKLKKWLFFKKTKSTLRSKKPKKVVLLNETTYQRNERYFRNERDRFLFSSEIEKMFPEVSMFYSKNAIISPEGPIFCDNKLVKGSEFISLSLYPLNFYDHILWNKRIKKSNGTYLSFHFLWSANFNHWFNDILPKIELLRLRGELSSVMNVILPRSHDKSYIKTSLEHYGLTNILFFEQDEVVLVDNCISLSPVAPVGNQRPEIMKSIRSHFQKRNGEPQKRFWITRKNELIRHLINEEELIPVLEEFNFKIIDPSSFCLNDQITLFSNAECIAGIHGAGLTNMLFMNHGKVLEIRMEDDNRNNVFFTLAESLDHKYFYAEGQCVNAKNDIHDADLSLSIGKLRSVLNEMFPK